jgi:hypothetical protein
MKKLTSVLVLTQEQCEVLRLALGHWIEDNEKCILDDMKDAARAERLDQLNYHVMLNFLFQDICDREEHLEDLSKEWPTLSTLPPLPDRPFGQQVEKSKKSRKDTPLPISEMSADDIDRCKILYDKGYNYDVIATHLAEWRGIKVESAVRQLKRYGMPPRRAKRKMRRT